MKTPIADFVRGYEKQNRTRFHMPGHKGTSFLGCESMDITEVAGADALYEADGIIAESEANATMLFGTGRTVYSTEGSSQCIRAMLYLAMSNWKSAGRPTVVAARNAHKAFVYAAALLDLDVVWLWPRENVDSLCSCPIEAEQLERVLQELEEPPVAVYVTSPDYLGGQLDIVALAEVCHQNNTILAVDNAHGAYLHFMEPSMHPIDLGADMTCDSAHKTLPVLTGGAYLHISKRVAEKFAGLAKSAMALFGSTSPSYLTLMSLDLCNSYLTEGYKERLENTIERVCTICKELKSAGWMVLQTEPLKITVRMPEGISGIKKANWLRVQGVECEYADREYVVCMITPENTEADLQKLAEAFGDNDILYKENDKIVVSIRDVACQRKMTIRDAIFAKQEQVPITEAVGRICGTPTVSCPPAIPIVVSGEMIGECAIPLFEQYGIKAVDVVKKE